jgi:hypothetical protein
VVQKAFDSEADGVKPFPDEEGDELDFLPGSAPATDNCADTANGFTEEA